MDTQLVHTPVYQQLNQRLRSVLAAEYRLGDQFLTEREIAGDLTSGGAGLSGDEFKLRLCELCERAAADGVKTSSGYGFVKQADGSYAYKGATEHDLKLMRGSCSSKVQVKAAGGVRDLDGLIKVRDLGSTRCDATATAAMLEEYRLRIASTERAPVKRVSSCGGGDY